MSCQADEVHHDPALRHLSLTAFVAAEAERQSHFAVAPRAAALRAQGIDVVSLAAGQPETPTTAAIVPAAQLAADDPALHRYGPAAGLPELREAIANQTTAAGIPTTTAQVQVTQGAKHALFNALAVLAAPGDDVLVVTPGWPGHTEVVLAARVNPVTVDTDPAGLRLTVDALDQARTPRTRALVSSNPGNPTGVLHTADEVRAIVAWCAAHDIHLIADDVYSQLTFDHAHVPAAAADPEHQDRITTIGAVSKAHAMTLSLDKAISRLTRELTQIQGRA